LHSFATRMDRINRRKPSISGEKIRTPPLSYHVLNRDVLPLFKKHLSGMKSPKHRNHLAATTVSKLGDSRLLD